MVSVVEAKISVASWLVRTVTLRNGAPETPREVLEGFT